MPVCLKCGKEIDPPRKFCEECGALGEREMRDALSGSQSKYKPRREHNTVSFIILAVVLFAIVGGLGYTMLTLLPNSKKIQTEAQANICHRNLVNIQQAIDKYYQNSHLQFSCTNNGTPAAWQADRPEPACRGQVHQERPHLPHHRARLHPQVFRHLKSVEPAAGQGHRSLRQRVKRTCTLTVMG